MRKRNERSLILFASIFVFACLLLSGGSRLIGHEGEGPVTAERAVFTEAVFCAAPAPMGEMGHTPLRAAAPQRLIRGEEISKSSAPARVCSDANGNVLRASSYLKTVHQAFSLGDGFV